MKSLKGRKIKLWTTRGFYYCGVVQSEDDTHIMLFDERKASEFLIARESVSEIQFLDGD